MGEWVRRKHGPILGEDAKHTTLVRSVGCSAEDTTQMSGNTIPIERKTCPKCSDTMNKVNVTMALPQITHEGVRLSSDKTPAISLTSVFPVETYYCEGCRFVELYAG